MGNVVFATTERVRAAALGSGPAPGAMTAANLKRRQPSDRLRLTDLAQAYVTADLGLAVPVTLVAPLYVSATPAATWRVRAAATAEAVTAAPGYDSGAMPLAGAAGLAHRMGTVHGQLFLAAPQAWRHWRIDLHDAANPAGYLDLGALVIADAWQPEVNISYDWSIGLVDPSRKRKAAAGEVAPLKRKPYLAGRFALDFGSEADLWGAAFDLDAACGTTEPALIVRDPELAEEYRQKQTIFGLFADLDPIANPHFAIYRKRYDIEELIP